MNKPKETKSSSKPAAPKKMLSLSGTGRTDVLHKVAGDLLTFFNDDYREKLADHWNSIFKHLNLPPHYAIFDGKVELPNLIRQAKAPAESKFPTIAISVEVNTPGKWPKTFLLVPFIPKHVPGGASYESYVELTQPKSKNTFSISRNRHIAGNGGLIHFHEAILPEGSPEYFIGNAIKHLVASAGSSAAEPTPNHGEVPKMPEPKETKFVWWPYPESEAPARWFVDSFPDERTGSLRIQLRRLWNDLFPDNEDPAFLVYLVSSKKDFDYTKEINGKLYSLGFYCTIPASGSNPERIYLIVPFPFTIEKDLYSYKVSIDCFDCTLVDPRKPADFYFKELEEMLKAPVKPVKKMADDTKLLAELFGSLDKQKHEILEKMLIGVHRSVYGVSTLMRFALFRFPVPTFGKRFKELESQFPFIKDWIAVSYIPKLNENWLFIPFTFPYLYGDRDYDLLNSVSPTVLVGKSKIFFHLPTENENEEHFLQQIKIFKNIKPNAFEIESEPVKETEMAKSIKPSLISINISSTPADLLCDGLASLDLAKSRNVARSLAASWDEFFPNIRPASFVVFKVPSLEVFEAPSSKEIKEAEKFWKNTQPQFINCQCLPENQDGTVYLLVPFQNTGENMYRRMINVSGLTCELIDPTLPIEDYYSRLEALAAKKEATDPKPQDVVNQKPQESEPAKENKMEIQSITQLCPGIPEEDTNVLKQNLNWLWNGIYPKNHRRSFIIFPVDLARGQDFYYSGKTGKTYQMSYIHSPKKVFTHEQNQTYGFIPYYPEPEELEAFSQVSIGGETFYLTYSKVMIDIYLGKLRKYIYEQESDKSIDKVTALENKVAELEKKVEQLTGLRPFSPISPNYQVPGRYQPNAVPQFGWMKGSHGVVTSKPDGYTVPRDPNFVRQWEKGSVSIPLESMHVSTWAPHSTIENMFTADQLFQALKAFITGRVFNFNGDEQINIATQLLEDWQRQQLEQPES
jgi:hypothetical protein